MNPYRGIIRMECEEDRCSKIAGRDVKPECIYCKAKITIVDLEGKVLAQSTYLEPIKTTVTATEEAPAPPVVDVKSPLTGTGAIRNPKSKITKEEV